MVNEADQVVSVEGYELRHHGKSQEDFPTSIKPTAEVSKEQCREGIPTVDERKYRSVETPVVVRGDYFESYILGEEPEWLTLCYRTDELGDCLECLSHLQSWVLRTENYTMQRPQSLGELSEFAGEKRLRALVCPLGGTYQFSGSTVTCFSHPEGPISVTRTEKMTRFWQGAP